MASIAVLLRCAILDHFAKFVLLVAKGGKKKKEDKNW